MHLDYLYKYLDISLYNKKYNWRRSNLSEGFTENLAKNIIFKVSNYRPTKPCFGDLFAEDDFICKNKLFKRGKIEIKCTSSSGPISFGPNENWSTLFIIDLSDLINLDNYNTTNIKEEILSRNIKMYGIPRSNEDIIWKNIKVNKKETISDQYKQKRRPRITFKYLEKQLIESDSIMEIYNSCII